MITTSQRKWILITLMMGTFISGMATTVTNTMLPAIINDFHIQETTAQWLTSGATLVSGITIPIAAFLIKRFPNKGYFLFAMCLFTVGSFLGFIAPSFPLLLGSRLIQAAGCGLLMPFAQVILMTIYPKEKHGSVMSIYALAATVAPVIAPVLAGFIIDSIGWQAIFILLSAIGLFIVAFGMFFMKNATENYKEKLPVLPVILSSLGFSALLIGLGNVSTHSLFTLQAGGALLLGFIAMGLFVFTQLRSEAVLLNLRVFRFPMFRASVFLSVLMYLICMGSGILLPIFLQSVLGYSATTYAVVILPGSIAMAVITLFSGGIYDKLGSKPLLISGVAMMFLGSILGLFFHQGIGLLYVGIVSFLISVGMGLINTPSNTMGLSDLQGKDRIDGSAILNTLRQIASSVASTFALVVYSVVSSQKSSDIAGVRGTYVCFLIFSALLVLVVFNLLRRNQKSACA